MPEGPHHATGYGISVCPDEFGQGLGLLLINSDVSASAAVFFCEAVVHVHGGRFFVAFGLNFIFDSSCEDSAVVGPAALFLSFYFSYYDVSFSLSEVVQTCRLRGVPSACALPKTATASLLFQTAFFASFGFALGDDPLFTGFGVVTAAFQLGK